MYRHLLVPLDDSPLSGETVRKAVEFARTLGAKVTFMHAEEDFDASSVGALQRVIAPVAYNDALAGEARAILSKAEVVAREMGVPYDSAAVTSNRPYEAILGTAASHGCDLIFMASHGRRGIKGLLLGSQTQKVLQHAAIPVLVSAIESNVPAGELVTPLTIIGDEHRSMAAVVQGLELIVRDARERRAVPSLPLLRAIVHYIRAFPEALHHPKEEAYLFRKLRERTSELDDTLAELERQHAESTRTVDQLERSIEAYAQDPSNGFAAFAAAARRFGEAQMAHMRLETKVILPAARKHLTAEDWVEIANAFGENGDPRFAADNDEEFRQLFARILNLAPVAVNVGMPDARPAPVR
jgi:nucleotide-binding universal stress UspA family protein/hemerythrin-like domain-containing protein